MLMSQTEPRESANSEPSLPQGCGAEQMLLHWYRQLGADDRANLIRFASALAQSPPSSR